MSDGFRFVSREGVNRALAREAKANDEILANRVNHKEAVSQFQKKIEESKAKLEACKNSKYPDKQKMERIEGIISELKKSIETCEQIIKER